MLFLQVFDFVRSGCHYRLQSGHAPEVLGDGRKAELVPSPGQPAQAHSFEAHDGLEVRKHCAHIIQSGISGSSPQTADPTRFARADPTRFGAEKGELILALSVERYTSRSPVMVPT